VGFFSDKKQVSHTDGPTAADDWSKDGRRFKQLWSIDTLQADKFFFVAALFNNIKINWVKYLCKIWKTIFLVAHCQLLEEKYYNSYSSYFRHFYFLVQYWYKNHLMKVDK
jgi:hypothetical protein